MQKKAVVATVVVLIIGAGLTLSSRPSYVEVSGRVYSAERLPVARATVTNDWDSATATTSARGEFRARVRQVAADEYMKFTARADAAAGCHRRIGSLESIPVDIVLDGRCGP
jgi:hypothetical protein